MSHLVQRMRNYRPECRGDEFLREGGGRHPFFERFGICAKKKKDIGRRPTPDFMRNINS